MASAPGADRTVAVRALDPLAPAPPASVEPTLPDLLGRIARAAAEAIGCRYAAVTLVDNDGHLEHFSTHGAEPGTLERVGRPPTHLGLLGAVLESGDTIRVPDVSLDPRAAGLPDHHPPLRSLLGVPLVLRGRNSGGLYLSEPEGRVEFSEDDQRRAEVAALEAAAEIEMVRTGIENRRRERWYTGAAELAKELVFGRRTDPMKLIADRVAEVADADLVLVIRRAGPDAEPAIVSAAGANAPLWVRLGPTLGPTLSHSPAVRVMESGKPMNATPVADVLPEHLRSGIDIDHLALVPLTGTTEARIVLGIGRHTGRRPFTASEAGMATMLAGQTALALELAETQVHRDHVALIEERDRIARDLHDHVIQQLFATGMAMQSVGRKLDGAAADIVSTSIDHIDESIKQIRATIYQLTVPILPADATLRARAGVLFDDLEPVLGFRPQFTVDGPAEFGMSDEIVEDCVAVLREALTNVARHAHAASASVALVVTEASVSLTVRDDGHGIGDTARRSGLANLRARAEKHGGTLTVRSRSGAGTRLIWSVPLASTRPSPSRISG